MTERPPADDVNAASVAPAPNRAPYALLAALLDEWERQLDIDDAERVVAGRAGRPRRCMKRPHAATMHPSRS